jgi:hypothetical protein
MASNLLERLARHSVAANQSIDGDTQTALESLRQMIVGTEQESIKQAHLDDQNFLDSQFSTIEQCGTTLATNQAEDAVAQAGIDAKRTMHADCRNELGLLLTDRDTKCTALANFENGLIVPPCAKPGHDTMGSWLQINSAWYTTNFATWTELNDACEAARSAYTTKDQACDTNQVSFESEFCGFRVQVHSTCTTYEQCYDAAVDTYETEQTAIVVREKTRKIDYTATEKITCYIDVLLSDDENDARAAKLQECQDKCVADDGSNVCEDDLTIIYHTLPDEQACSRSAVTDYPCIDAFLADYAGFVDLRDCTSCSALPSHLSPFSSPGRVIWTRTMEGSTSYALAQQHCEAQGARLCNREEICPNGHAGGETPAGGKASGDSWVPVGDEDNQWVQTGNAHWPSCQLHTEIANGVHGKPGWGPTTVAHGFRHDVCCVAAGFTHDPWEWEHNAVSPSCHSAAWQLHQELDGNSGTRSGCNNWYTLDLGEVRSVKETFIEWEACQCDASRGGPVRLYSSEDGQTYSPYYTHTFYQWGGHTTKTYKAPVTGRYFRVERPSKSGTTWMSMWEFRLVPQPDTAVVFPDVQVVAANDESLTLEQMAAKCPAGYGLVKLQSAEHIRHLAVKFEQAGFDHGKHCGAAIASKVSHNPNIYKTLGTTERDVTAFFQELYDSHEFGGDWMTHQGDQGIAGFGWGSLVGTMNGADGRQIHDFSTHCQQAVFCEAQR